MYIWNIQMLPLMRHILLLLFTWPLSFMAQSYTSYFTGNTTDKETQALGGICLMGGATEDDNAMRWFLQNANGGDVLVLRTSGADGYNEYMYSELGVKVNSVETIVCNTAAASSSAYVLRKIRQAEAIWFAGGNQWTYVDFWRGTPVNDALLEAIQQRKIVIGGTSAGMAIQGQYYSSAQNGTVTSATALSNPYSKEVVVDSTAFLKNRFLENTITDTHFDNPDRKGRLVTFMARIVIDYLKSPYGIACDEYTAVCIDTAGLARVFGRGPARDDNAFFIQANCALGFPWIESCRANIPLTWSRGSRALNVYQIKGDSKGTNTFDLKTWRNGSGGTWWYWSVISGEFSESENDSLDCTPVSVGKITFEPDLIVFPNPAHQQLQVQCTSDIIVQDPLQCINSMGQHFSLPQIRSGAIIELDVQSVPSGTYWVAAKTVQGHWLRKKVLILH